MRHPTLDVSYERLFEDLRELRNTHEKHFRKIMAAIDIIAEVQAGHQKKLEKDALQEASQPLMVQNATKKAEVVTESKNSIIPRASLNSEQATVPQNKSIPARESKFAKRFSKFARDTESDEEEDGRASVQHPTDALALPRLSAKDEMGEPVGEFKGRPNLFAFLQAKNWDSTTCVDPDVEIDVAPTEKSRWKMLQDFVMSPRFDVFVGVFILGNSIVMALNVEYEGMLAADALRVERDGGEFPGAEKAFLVLNHIFTILFLVELVVRLSVMHCMYFKQTIFNWMDFTVVVTSVLELYVFAIIGSSAPNMSIFKLLRTLRIFRALRILRVLRLFEKLRTLVVAIGSSLRHLGCSMVLLAIIVFIASIFMTLALQSFLQDENEDEAIRRQVYIYFGSFSRACITLFEITLAPGSWAAVGRVIIFDVNRSYAIFFLGYMTFVSFAMIRVITAIFLKETLSSAARDKEIMTSEDNRRPEFVKKLRRIFNDLDLANEGFINLYELHLGLQDMNVCKQLTSMGINHHEVEGLFILMDDGDDEITFAEFLTGCMRLKNAKLGVDLATLLYENKKLLSRVLKVGNKVDKVRQYLCI